MNFICTHTFQVVSAALRDQCISSSAIPTICKIVSDLATSTEIGEKTKNEYIRFLDDFFERESDIVIEFLRKVIYLSGNLVEVSYSKKFEVVIGIAQNLDLLLAKKDVKDILKSSGTSYVELRARSYRINKKIKNHSGIRQAIDRPFNVRSLIDVVNIANSLKEMSALELLEYKRAISEYSVSELVDKCKDYEYKGYEERTITSYDYIYGLITKNFGSILVKNLSHSDVRSWAMASHLSKGIVNKVLNFLKDMLSDMVDECAIDAEILYRINFRKIKKDVKNKEVKTCQRKKRLSLKEAEDVEQLDEQILIKEGLYSAWLSFIFEVRSQGSRPGELRVASLSDIVKYGEQYKLLRRIASSPSGYKTVKVPKGEPQSSDIYEGSVDALIKLIKDAKQYDKKQIKVYEKGYLINELEAQFLVVNPKTGEHFTEDEYREAIIKIQKLANISVPIPPRYLRHTFTSTQIESGVSAEVVCKQIGHCSDQNTKKHYTEITHVDTREEVKQVERKVRKQRLKHLRANSNNIIVKVASNLKGFFDRHFTSSGRLEKALN